MAESKKEVLKEKVEGFWAEKGSAIIGYAILGGIVVSSYTFGRLNTQVKISRGIEKLWLVDPELKPKMWNALNKVVENNN